MEQNNIAQEMDEAAEALAQQQARIQELEAQLAAVGRVETAYKTLRIPQGIRELVPFDGTNPNKLNRFIEAVDEVIPCVDAVAGTNSYRIWLQAIRSKITGPADDVLESSSTRLDWDEIKEKLIVEYSDKRDEACLIKDMFALKQEEKTVKEFYGEVQSTIALLVNAAKLNEGNPSVRISKTTLYQGLGLKVFLGGLHEELGKHVRSLKPTCLPDALALCIEETNYQSHFGSKQPTLSNNRQNWPVQQFPIFPNNQHNWPIQAPYSNYRQNWPIQTSAFANNPQNMPTSQPRTSSHNRQNWSNQQPSNVANPFQPNAPIQQLRTSSNSRQNWSNQQTSNFANPSSQSQNPQRRNPSQRANQHFGGQQNYLLCQEQSPAEESNSCEANPQPNMAEELQGFETNYDEAADFPYPPENYQMG